MPTFRIADSLAAETARLRAAGLLPDQIPDPAPSPAAPPRSPDDLGDPDCPLCRGLGYTRRDVPVGQGDTRASSQFGKLDVCECARARLDAAASRQLRAATGLSDEDAALDWSVIYQTPGLADAKRAVRDTLDRGWGWVYLYGVPGPGKTLLLKVAIAETIRAGTGAVFVTWPDLLNHLRAGFDAGDYQARLDAWRGVPVLAVDEFGRANDTRWVEEAQSLVFNHRYETALKAGPRRTVTLFASNFPPDSDRIDDWFFDRIRDGRFCLQAVTGPSLRPRMGAAPAP